MTGGGHPGDPDGAPDGDPAGDRAGEPSPGGPPPSTPPRKPLGGIRPRRRSPLTPVLAVALVAVLSAGALLAAQQSTRDPSGAPPEPGADLSSVAPSTTPPPRTPEQIAARLKVIQERVAAARGLAFQREVPAEIQPAAELATSLLAQVDEETDETELRRYGRALHLLGQLPDGTDLAALMRDLQAEGVLGYYLPGTGEGEGRLYVRGDSGLTPFVEWVLAHELTHAVTDQQFDLTYADRLTDAGRDDEALAYSALVEGDATLLMGQYLQTQMRPEDQVAVAQEGMEETTPELDAAPAVIRQSLGFPYQAGHTFVRALYAEGGWDAVNRAYADPPTSSEQILHPEKYLADRRDDPQAVSNPNVAAELGSGWQPGVTTGWGEADTRWLLAESDQVPNTAASGGADGWDGGALTTFERGSDTALVLRTVWDSPAESTEYCETLSRWASDRFGAGTPTQQGATWTGDGQHTALHCADDRSVWLSAPDTYTLQRLQATTGTP